MATERHALHWVLKVADRNATVKFLRNVLGMKVLRHEEFEKGCDAACNGPYDGKWSKTMIGYGPEATYFVLELTYNYGIGSYDYQHDYRGMTIVSQQIVDRVKKSGYSHEDIEAHGVKVTSPDGYPFFVYSTLPSNIASDTTPSSSSHHHHQHHKSSAGAGGAGDAGADADPIHHVSISVSDLDTSKKFWTKTLGMQLVEQETTSDKKDALMLTYADKVAVHQCMLELVETGSVDHGTAFGRIAFMCPHEQQADIEERVKKSAGKIHTHLISLDTPGKATVQVVIALDPDGYEICFVGREAFKELCQVDPEADRLLDEAIASDDSKAWFEKKGKSKASAEK